MEHRPRLQCARDRVLRFKDHTDSLSLVVFKGLADTSLPPLWSFVFYFTHPETRIGDVEPTAIALLSTFIMWPDDVRLDIHFLPNAMDKDCIDHFKAELRHRGSVFAQIAALDAPDDDLTLSDDQLPGLVPRYGTSSEPDFYSNFIFVITTRDWQNEGKQLTFVEFGALEEEEYRRCMMEDDGVEVDGPLPEMSSKKIWLRNEDMVKAGRMEDVANLIADVRLGTDADEVIEAWGRGMDKGWQTWPARKASKPVSPNSDRICAR